MYIIKFLILTMIFLLSAFVGILISKKYVSRVIELKEIRNALNMLEAKIKFTYEPLSEIFNTIAKNLRPNISKIFSVASNKMNKVSAKEAWELAIDEASLNINNEDKNVLKDLGKLLRADRFNRSS